MTAVLAAVVIIVIAGFAIYRDQVVPFRKTVLVVGDRRISMRYFLTRSFLAGQAPLSMLQTLTDEEIIKQTAPAPPYNIVVTDEEVDRFLRDAARGKNDTVSDTDYEEWYRQQINESRLSEEEFRELARTNLLTRRFSAYLAERTPTVAEQVRLHVIAFRSLPEAKNAKARIDAGEGFSVVAGDFATDEQLRASSEHGNWYPRTALAPHIATAAFDTLSIGEVSEPLVLNDESVVLVMVSERAAAREIDDQVLENLRARALENWLDERKPEFHVEFHGLRGGFDSETNAWVQWQLARMERAGGRP